MKKSILFKIFGLPIAILIIGSVFYFFNFNGKFSTKVQDWGNFGSYINAFISLASMSVVIIFLLVYRYNNSINQPILVFKTVTFNDTEIWQISNIGNGPAMNLIVGYTR